MALQRVSRLRAMHPVLHAQVPRHNTRVHQICRHWGSRHQGKETLVTRLDPLIFECSVAWSGMIYSGSGYRFEFSEFRTQAQLAQVPDPCGSGSNPYYSSIIGNQKEESINYLPFSISQYSPTVLLYSPEFSGLNFKIKVLIYLLFNSCWIRIHNTGTRTILVCVMFL